MPALVGMAVSQGAQIILLPEMLGGYSYSKEAWEGAEREGGATTQLLCELSLRHKVHVGASFMEARGEHFYNTFVLCADGQVCHFSSDLFRSCGKTE